MSNNDEYGQRFGWIPLTRSVEEAVARARVIYPSRHLNECQCLIGRTSYPQKFLDHRTFQTKWVFIQTVPSIYACVCHGFLPMRRDGLTSLEVPPPVCNCRLAGLSFYLGDGFVERALEELLDRSVRYCFVHGAEARIMREVAARACSDIGLVDFGQTVKRLSHESFTDSGIRRNR